MGSTVNLLASDENPTAPVDRGLLSGLTSVEKAEFAARKRIAEQETGDPASQDAAPMP